MKPKQATEIRERIASMSKWQSADNELTFVKVAIKMVENGFSVDDAVDALEELYGATWDECCAWSE